MTTTQPRKPAGVPTGGQFANKTHPAPGYELDGGDREREPHPKFSRDEYCPDRLVRDHLSALQGLAAAPRRSAEEWMVGEEDGRGAWKEYVEEPGTDMALAASGYREEPGTNVAISQNDPTRIQIATWDWPSEELLDRIPENYICYELAVTTTLDPLSDDEWAEALEKAAVEAE